ncbi:MAG: hypothetical protein QOE35_3544 [Actinomycetota bacterium]
MSTNVQLIRVLLHQHKAAIKGELERLNQSRHPIVREMWVTTQFSGVQQVVDGEPELMAGVITEGTNDQGCSRPIQK